MDVSGMKRERIWKDRSENDRDCHWVFQSVGRTGI